MSPLCRGLVGFMLLGVLASSVAVSADTPTKAAQTPAAAAAERVEVLKKAVTAAEDAVTSAEVKEKEATKTETDAGLEAGRVKTVFDEADKNAKEAGERAAKAAKELKKAEMDDAAVTSPVTKAALKVAMDKDKEAKDVEALAKGLLATAQTNKDRADKEYTNKFNAKGAAEKATAAARSALSHAKGKLEGADEVQKIVAAIPTVQVTVGAGTTTPAPAATAWNLKLSADAKTLIATHPDGDSFIYDVTNKRVTTKEK